MILKRVLLFTLILSISLFSLSGCGKNDFENYIDALEKTNSITKGQSLNKATISMEYNTEGLTEEEIKKLNYFRNVESETKLKFDNTQNKIITKNYFNFGGLGFDTEYYFDGDKAYIKLPILGKYIKLDQYIQQYGAINKANNYEDNAIFITNETKEKIKDEWMKLFGQKDVVSGENILLSTEDGEVKAKYYTINLTGEQVKSYVAELINILLNDELFTQYIFERNSILDKNSKNKEEIIQELNEWVEKFTITDFNYSAYIDVDGYIIKENISVFIKLNSDKQEKIKEIQFNLERENWDIEKEQKFDFPVLTEENTLDINNIDQGIPFIFNDMMGKM